MSRKVVSHYAVFENIGGGRDVVFYYEDGGADTVNGIPAAEADFIVDLLRNETPMSYDHSRKRLSTWSFEEVGEAESSPTLDTWLSNHPSVAASLVWEDANGAHKWSSWSATWKQELRDAFDAARSRGSIAVKEVPPNQKTFADDASVTTVLAKADAWAYFKASVAQSLAVEIGQYVLWSIEAYSSDQLAQLFDSRTMFTWHTSPAGYEILESTHGRVVPAPPAYSYEFLGTSGLIATTPLDTMARVVGWCRDNLIHFSGDTTAANMEDQWQYRGAPPMTRVIEGTVQTSHASWGVAHRTAGCRGTTGFLRALLRVVNIPAKLIINSGHAQTKFMVGPRYLSHGDDPYNALTTATPQIPAAEILIDQATYDSWFGGGVSSTDQANNIGRQTRELALTYLPNYLLDAYCRDISNGKTHAHGEVFDTFSMNYTVAQLEAKTLWTRMDAKIAGFGGCGSIP